MIISYLWELHLWKALSPPFKVVNVIIFNVGYLGSRFVSQAVINGPFPAMPAPTVPFSILLCLTAEYFTSTPDNFTCQGKSSGRHDRVKLKFIQLYMIYRGKPWES